LDELLLQEVVNIDNLKAWVNQSVRQAPFRKVILQLVMALPYRRNPMVLHDGVQIEWRLEDSFHFLTIHRNRERPRELPSRLYVQ
jgi:hypothetical protein